MNRETSTGQYLPIPIGRTTPAHATRSRRRRRGLLRWLRVAGTTAGCIAAGAGLWLGASAPPTSVFADGEGVHVAGSLLTLLPATAGSAVRIYSGDATMIVMTLSPHDVKGVAVTRVNGTPVVGTCLMHADRDDVHERCRFSVGPRQLEAVDRYSADGGVWLRSYSDGGQVRVDAPIRTDLVPIPFPIGRI